MNITVIQKIAHLSKYYKELFERSSVSFTKEPNHQKIADDSWLSLISFLDRVYFQGRNDTLSGRYERAMIKALECFFGHQGFDKIRQLEQDGFLYWRYYGYEHKDGTPKRQYSRELYNAIQGSYEFVHEGKNFTYETGKTRDKAMVLDILHFIASLEDLNILRYTIEQIKAHNLSKIDKELRKIHQVGEKTCSMFLRDTVSFYNLDKYLSRTDFELLQPVDTWVHQMAQKIHLIDDTMNIDELKKKRYIITNAAFNAKVSPIDFNQGLWYLPTHAVDLIIEEYER